MPLWSCCTTRFSPFTTPANLSPIRTYSLAPGVADIGAYEFLGNSQDTTPPTVTAVSPNGIAANGTVAAYVGPVALTFSEPINPIDAAAPANYELRSPGPDGTFGDADDVIYQLIPQYTSRSVTVTLEIPGEV